MESSRYLVALLGDTHWARNLRATGMAKLREGGTTRTIQAREVLGDERRAAVARYLETSTYRPTIRLLTTRLPDPDDHPVFRIVTLQAAGAILGVSPGRGEGSAPPARVAAQSNRRRTAATGHA